MTTDLDKQREFEARRVDGWSIVKAQMNDVERQPRECKHNDDSHQHLDHFHLLNTYNCIRLRNRVLLTLMFSNVLKKKNATS